MQLIRKYLVAGLLVWVPLVITLWVLDLIVTMMDKSLSLLPENFHPDVLLGRHIPGLGVVLTLIVVLLTGVFAANIMGRRLLMLWDVILRRIPVVKSIYSSVKQVSDTLFSGSGQAFRKALLIEYPHKGSWTIAFLTGAPGKDVAKHLPQDCVSVYVPTTPNPTSGFFLIVPKSDTIELDMSVDTALKYIISMGVVTSDVNTPHSS